MEESAGGRGGMEEGGGEGERGGEGVTRIDGPISLKKDSLNGHVFSLD